MKWQTRVVTNCDSSTIRILQYTNCIIMQSDNKGILSHFKTAKALKRLHFRPGGLSAGGGTPYIGYTGKCGISRWVFNAKISPGFERFLWKGQSTGIVKCVTMEYYLLYCGAY